MGGSHKDSSGKKRSSSTKKKGSDSPEESPKKKRKSVDKSAHEHRVRSRRRVGSSSGGDEDEIDGGDEEKKEESHKHKKRPREKGKHYKKQSAKHSAKKLKCAQPEEIVKVDTFVSATKPLKRSNKKDSGDDEFVPKKHPKKDKEHKEHKHHKHKHESSKHSDKNEEQDVDDEDKSENMHEDIPAQEQRPKITIINKTRIQISRSCKPESVEQDVPQDEHQLLLALPTANETVPQTTDISDPPSILGSVETPVPSVPVRISKKPQEGKRERRPNLAYADFSLDQQTQKALGVPVVLAQPPLKKETRGRKKGFKLKAPKVKIHINTRETTLPSIPTESDMVTKCRNLLMSIMRSPGAEDFMDPVDPVALNIPDYLDVIKNPMDFGTIRERLENAYYNTHNAFAEDMRLVFSNAMCYNPPENEVHRAAVKFSTFFESRFAALFPYTDEITEMQAVVIDSNPIELCEYIRSSLFEPHSPKVQSMIDSLQDMRVLVDRHKKASSATSVLPATATFTPEAKLALGVSLSKLPEVHLSKVADIIRENVPELFLFANTQRESHLEIDLQALDSRTLTLIQDFLDAGAERISEPQHNSIESLEPPSISQDSSSSFIEVVEPLDKLMESITGEHQTSNDVKQAEATESFNDITVPAEPRTQQPPQR